MNATEVRDVLRLLFAAYPTQRQRMSDEDVKAMFAAYAAGLDDLDANACAAAVSTIVKTSRFLPSIAEVRAAVGEVLGGGPQRSGAEAWGDVRRLRSFRDRSAPGDIDPLVLLVCDAQGWIETRTLTRSGEDIDQWHVVTGENEAADRARFIELYDKLTAADRRAGQLAPGGVIPRRIASPNASQLGGIVNGLLPKGVS